MKFIFLKKMLTQIQYNKLYILYNVTSYIQYNNNKYILF